MQAMPDGDEIVSVRDGSAPNLNVTKDALGVGDWQREVRTPLPAITATATHRHHERASCRRGQPAAACNPSRVGIYDKLHITFTFGTLH